LIFGNFQNSLFGQNLLHNLLYLEAKRGINKTEKQEKEVHFFSFIPSVFSFKKTRCCSKKGNISTIAPFFSSKGFPPKTNKNEFFFLSLFILLFVPRFLLQTKKGSHLQNKQVLLTIKMLPKHKRNKHWKENKRMSTLKKGTFFSTHASVCFLTQRVLLSTKKQGK
jgi:hypothetical protein